MANYICSVCGFTFSEDAENRSFDELPDDYECPVCNASKDQFEED